MVLAGNEGLVGLVAGLGIGSLDYAVMTRVLQRRLGASDGEIAPGGQVTAQRLARIIQVVLVVTSFAVFPLVGYFVGRMMG